MMPLAAERDAAFIIMHMQGHAANDAESAALR
jgi:hypothetical protein